MDGLEYVTSLIRRSAEIERLYLSQHDIAYDLLAGEMAKLYAKILEYHARAACQFNRNTAVQIARNIVQLDEWEVQLNDIKIIESNCDKIMRTLDSEGQQARLQTLEGIQRQQDARVLELLAIARSQDIEYSKAILNELSVSQQDQRDWRRTEEETKCCECLRTTDYELGKNKNPERSPGTCEWFLQHPKYLAWLHGTGPAWLWLTADPGCGKSVLSRYLVDELRTSMPESKICYYFFKDDSEEGRSAIHAICAILHQLLTLSNEVMGHALTEYQRNGSKLAPLFYPLWDTFCKTALDVKSGKIIVVFDALDEYGMETRFLLVEKLSQLIKNQLQHAKVKVIVTSRPSTAFGDALCRHGQDSESIQLNGENQAERDAITKEIKFVIKDRIERFALLRK